jgi:hypothetical protein
MSPFRDVHSIIESAGNVGILEAQLMPEVQREQLCRDLLEEFGATNVVTRGDELWCCCVMPHHADRRPSASLNYKNLVYKCFSCGSGGGLIWLVGTCQGGGDYQARAWISTHTGTSGDSLVDLMTLWDALYSPTSTAQAPIPTMDPRVLDPWRFIHPWVTEKRHVPEETVLRFQIGYGVIPINIGTYEQPIWVKSPRIVVPHFWRGNLVGWQSRRLLKNDGTAKYISTPDFPRERTIFNHDPSQPMAIVVESPFSVLRHAHHAHVVSTFGAAITPAQIRILAEYSRIVVWMDNDDAGWRAVAPLSEALSAYTMVSVVDSRWAADPADFDDAAFDRLVADAVPDALWRPPPHLEVLCSA